MDLSAIGERIERELGRVADNSLLGKWMAHRVAELMARAESTSGEAKVAADAELQALLLDLWKMRAELPGNVDPENRLKRALAVLEQLDDNRSYFVQTSQENNPVAHIGAKAYRDIATLNAQLTTLLMAEDFDLYCEDEENLPVDPEIVEIRQKLENMLAEFVQGRIFITTAKETKETLSVRTLVKKKMTRTIDELIISLQTVRDTLEPAPAKRARKGKAAKPSGAFARVGYRKI